MGNIFQLAKQTGALAAVTGKRDKQMKEILSSKIIFPKGLETLCLELASKKAMESCRGVV